MMTNERKPMNPFIEHEAEFDGRWQTELWMFQFPNGFGASVIRGFGTYGSAQGLWELAVLDADGELNCSTPVTDGVIGYCDVERVRELLRQIASL